VQDVPRHSPPGLHEVKHLLSNQINIGAVMPYRAPAAGPGLRTPHEPVPRGGTTSAVLMVDLRREARGDDRQRRFSAEDVADSCVNDSRSCIIGHHEMTFVPPAGFESATPGLGALLGASSGGSMPDFGPILGYFESRADHRSTSFHCTSHSIRCDAQINPASAQSSRCSWYRSPIRVHVADHQGASSSST
jgi:hypothetical protein